MRRVSFLMMGLAAVGFSVSLSAQGGLNLAGKWTLVPEAGTEAGGGGGRGGGGRGGFCGTECTIAQDATTLTITRTTQGGEQKTVYKLDGSESKNSMPGRQGGAPMEVVSKATASGNAITISTTREFNGNSMTTKTVVSKKGDQMVVENTSDRGQGPTTTTQTYKKD